MEEPYQPFSQGMGRLLTSQHSALWTNSHSGRVKASSAASTVSLKSALMSHLSGDVSQKIFEGGGR